MANKGRFGKGNKIGKGGKRAGSGRPTDKVRQACRDAFSKRVSVLSKIADSKDEKTRDRIAALQLLAKVGIPDQVSVTDPEGQPVPLMVLRGVSMDDL